MSQRTAGRLASEFFVIVIGVLVALGVDAWYDGFQDRSTRDEYLTRLLDDLRSERTFIQRTLEHTEEIGAMTDALTPFFEAGSMDGTSEEVMAVLNYSSNRRIADPVVPAYEDLMNTGNLGLFEDQQFRADLHEAWGYVRRIHANTHYGRTYRQLVRGMVPVAIQDAVAANCGNTWSWRDCSIGAIPGAGEALAAIAARADVREAFRLHNRELRTYQRDLRAVLNRIDTFILEYGGNR